MGLYYWRDSIDNRRYRLRRPTYERNLSRHVEHGCELQTHDDMPDDIRNQLYTKEQQDIDHKQKHLSLLQ